MKSYEKLEMELIKFDVEDVIRTSTWDVEEEGGNDNTGDHGVMMPASLFE